MLIRVRDGLQSPLWKPQPPWWLVFAWWLGPPLAVLLTVLWLWKMLAPLMREREEEQRPWQGPQSPSGFAKCVPRGRHQVSAGRAV